MADPRNRDIIGPYEGDVYTGHLATPISASDFTKTFIGNLPAYRRGLSPILRGLEIGMAHGYWIIGPWVVLGPLRDSEFAELGGLISGLAIILIATACLAIYGLASFQGDIPKNIAPDKSQGWAPLRSAEGWSQFTAGFFVGGMGGAFVAYFLLENLNVIDGIMRGVFNA